MFEIVWLHRCGLVFGNSVWSTSVVLSSFMAGLAVGSALVRAYGHRLRRLLWMYAALELTVAVTGVGLTYLLPALTPLLAPAIRPIIDVPWLTTLVRLAAAFLVLLVPSTAMGATLPVLVPALSRARGDYGIVLGQLYGSNTLGAVAGVLIAEILLIDRIGIAATSWVAGLLNVTAAAVALVMARRHDSDDGAVAEPAAVRMRRTGPASRLLMAAFLAGTLLMALEVVWFRFLSMFVLNSTLIMALMIAVVLSGIGTGGLAASMWLGRRSSADAYASALGLSAACTSAGSYLLFQPLTAGPWTTSWTSVLWYTFVLTFATAVVSGALFTVIGTRLRQEIPSDTHAGASLLLANTVGAVVGPLVATFVLLPWAGMERTLFALAFLYVGIAALVLARRPRWSDAPGRAVVVSAVAATIVLARFPFGSMTNTFFPRVAATYSGDGSRVVATREGIAETILLMRRLWLGRSLYDRLVTNGFSMSGTHLTGKRYMRYFAYWPMFVRRDPLRHVLVICYGAGVTTGAVTDIRSVETIDVAEISRDIVAMSELIYEPADRPLNDRRVRLHVEDARQLLQVSPDRFDLITGEPPPPLTPGAVNLYTREYFRLMYDRLAEGGVATYWVPVARDGNYDVAPIIKAFCDVFDDCSLWNGTPFDWMLVGSRHVQALATDAAFAGPWSEPVLGRHLREIGFEFPPQVGATFLGDAGYLRSLTAQTSPLTDDYPRRLLPTGSQPIFADARNPPALDRFRAVIDSGRAREAFRRSPFIEHVWPKAVAEDTVPWFRAQDIINRVMLEGATPLRHIEELHAQLTTTSLRRLPLWMLGSDDVVQDVADTGDDATGMVEYQLGLRSLALRSFRAAANYLAAAERRGLRAPTIRPLEAYALCLSGQLDRARELAAESAPTNADERHFWNWLASEFSLGASRKE